jgi:hypothetical protein
MAIQLNERDYLIFKLLAEHKVLLEKHIAWFITHEDKPVLIRDRLRKLFYLDYVLCQRYDNKLPWWTTPTKPLVYMLAPLAKDMVGTKNGDNEALDGHQQQKYLEIANIRMIFLIAQTEGFLQNFRWTTCLPGENNTQLFDAAIAYSNQSVNHRLGLLSHPELSDEFLSRIEQGLVSGNITNLMIISRDQTHQANLQKLLADDKSQAYANKIIFAVHQDLYKSGLDKVQWRNVADEQMNFFNQSKIISPLLPGQNPIFTDMHAA